MASRLLSVVAAAVASTASAAAAVTPVTVYKAYQPAPSSECYRQPILMALPQPPGTLLAIAEGRNNISYCSGTDWPDMPDFPIVVKRSADFGASWGPELQIMRGNLDFLTSVFDPSTGVVHLMVQLGDDNVLYATSSNGGASWSALVNVTIAGNYASIIPGVGHGVAIDPSKCLDPTCGGTAGRLLMPWACTVEGPVSNDTACSNCRTCLVASDDHGATWYLSAVSTQAGSRESALVQLNSADWATMGAVIYASERNLGANPGVRLHAVSTDGGKTFASQWYGVDQSLPDIDTGNWTGVVSGLARVAAPSSSSSTGGGLRAASSSSSSSSSSVDRLVFTAPYNSVAQRANLTAFVSSGIGPGLTWSLSKLGPIWPGDAAYSDALQINATHLGVLFECGSGGDFAAQVAFAAIPLAAL